MGDRYFNVRKYFGIFYKAILHDAKDDALYPVSGIQIRRYVLETRNIVHFTPLLRRRASERKELADVVTE